MEHEACCPMCGDGHAILLGALGVLVWLRCRDCGRDYHIHSDGAQWDGQYADEDADEADNREDDQEAI